jgi:hypothetical protein
VPQRVSGSKSAKTAGVYDFLLRFDVPAQLERVQLRVQALQAVFWLGAVLRRVQHAGIRRLRGAMLAHDPLPLPHFGCLLQDGQKVVKQLAQCPLAQGFDQRPDSGVVISTSCLVVWLMTLCMSGNTEFWRNDLFTQTSQPLQANNLFGANLLRSEATLPACQLCLAH